MHLLMDNFNHDVAGNIMCRSMISVCFDGALYDCDFNQMLELPVAVKSSKNIANYDPAEMQGRNIVLNNHCYGCTAGEGSSCQGAIL